MGRLIKYFKKKLRQSKMSEKEKIFDNMNECITQVEKLISKRKTKGFTYWTSGSYGYRIHMNLFINSANYKSNIFFNEAKNMFIKHFENLGYTVEHKRSYSYQMDYFIYQLTIDWEEMWYE